MTPLSILCYFIKRTLLSAIKIGASYKGICLNSLQFQRQESGKGRENLEDWFEQMPGLNKAKGGQRATD